MYTYMYVYIYICIYICMYIYIYMHVDFRPLDFVFLCVPWTQGVNCACSKTFRSCPEYLRNVLCMFRWQAVSRAGSYI